SRRIAAEILEGMAFGEPQRQLVVGARGQPDLRVEQLPRREIAPSQQTAAGAAQRREVVRQSLERLPVVRQRLFELALGLCLPRDLEQEPGGAGLVLGALELGAARLADRRR